MMASVVRKVILGVLMGGVLSTAVLSDMEMSSGESFLVAIIVAMWSIGFVYSARHYLDRLNKLLTPALKVSFISFLSFGSGILGFIVLVLYIMLILSLGWLYGLFLLIMDIASYLSL